MTAPSRPRLAGGIALLSAALVLVAAAPAANSVSGLYRGNGKDAKLAHLVVLPHENWDDKPVVTLVFTEQDPKGDKKVESAAMSGKYGSYLVARVTQDGSVIGTEVGHEGLQRKGFSSSGTLDVQDFRWADGTVSGKLTSSGEKEFFDDRWQIDLEFRGKLP